MENKKYPGYVTEKILMAFLGGTVPIYYGSAWVFRIFNGNAFVYYDWDDPAPALAQIAHLERNRTAYLEMLRAPILANGVETLEKYFSIRDDIGGGQLKSRILSMLSVA